MSKLEYNELIAFHPGYYIKDIIEDMEITQEEFAKRLGVSGKTISKLLAGAIPLSNDIAIQLSRMLGTSVNVWLKLQSTYDEKALEIEKRKKEDSEISIVSLIDYTYFTKYKLVTAAKNKSEQVKNLCKYLCIADLNILSKKDFLLNYRVATTTLNEKNAINSRIWIQVAINCGKLNDTQPFNSKLLISYLPEIRSMTIQKPESFLPRLKQIFDECGVSFVLLPHLKNSGINGAVKWINSDKVILALNDRRNYADTFWFSLFHEIKHVLQQKIKLLIVSTNKKEEITEIDNELEQDADKFAQDYLIPKQDYIEFIGYNNFSRANVINFANKINIHPGIVVGRLQIDGFINFSNLNDLKEKYAIVFKH